MNLIRTGFSVSTREAGDVSAAYSIYKDACSPKQLQELRPYQFYGTVSWSLYREIPDQKMKEGDVFLTNDP
ncbi:MAG: hypothetical protein CM15mP62_19840 [Rhodospirillaceae bacterium]|nr:MAG: hypothetical protein CM15mP62_19840 [Rhodospirillaceae bacterium]